MTRNDTLIYSDLDNYEPRMFRINIITILRLIDRENSVRIVLFKEVHSIAYRA